MSLGTVKPLTTGPAQIQGLQNNAEINSEEPPSPLLFRDGGLQTRPFEESDFHTPLKPGPVSRIEAGKKVLPAIEPEAGHKGKFAEKKRGDKGLKRTTLKAADNEEEAMRLTD